MPLSRTIGLTLIVLSIVPDLGRGQQRQTAAQLLGEFKSIVVFWQQFEIAQSLIKTRDASVLPELESWLNLEDRHLRGNARPSFWSRCY